MVENDRQDARLADAAKLAEQGELDIAWGVVEEHLREYNPDNPRALILACSIQSRAQKISCAYLFARRAAELAPKQWACWQNLGRCQEQMYQFDEAESSYQKAIALVRPGSPEHLQVMVNWGAMRVSRGDFRGSIPISEEALKINPEHRKARANLGLALLAIGEWERGWPLYDAIVGFGDDRKMTQYAKEPNWDGTGGKKLVIVGEQGLGDEISFASMVPDAVERCSKVTIDCDGRLKGLFQRSFPKAKVYGTRWEKALAWDKEDQSPDYSCSIGQLGKFFRPNAESCPGTPFLKADPERVAMWKWLFGQKQKPIIGVAWSGGVPWTGRKFRKWRLKDLLPIFQSVDAHWVCLQYKDAEDEIKEFREKYPRIDIKQYPQATLTQDYDDVAGIVAACDHVVSMQTAVIHLAGGLGIPTYCFVHKHSQWRYGVSGDSIPWYRSVKLYRQSSSGDWPIGRAAHDLSP